MKTLAQPSSLKFAVTLGIFVRHLPRVRRRLRPGRHGGAARARAPSRPRTRPIPGIVGRLRAKLTRRAAAAAAHPGVARPGVRRRRRARRLRPHGRRRLPALQAGTPLRRGRHHHRLRSRARTASSSQSRSPHAPAQVVLPPAGLPARARPSSRSCGRRSAASTGGLRAVVPGRHPGQADRHLRQRLALADPARGPGHRHEVRLPLRARTSSAATSASSRRAPWDSTRWRLYETIRLTRKPVECTTDAGRRAPARAGRPLRGDPALHAVRRTHHAGTVVRRAGRRDEDADRRHAALRRAASCCSRRGSAACCGWCRPAGCASFAGNVIDSATAYSTRRALPAAGARPGDLRAAHDDAHVLLQRDGARHPERARRARCCSRRR